jgi:hypothetical protein
MNIDSLPHPYDTERLRVYFVASSGSAIAAQEIEPLSGIRIRVSHPATFRPKEDGTGFEFLPVLFVEKDMEIFSTALLGMIDMPDIVRSSYLEYVRRRENNLPN